MTATTQSTTRHGTLLAGGALLAANRLLLAAGLRRRVDGWRCAAGQVLRGEESAFVLSAFGLAPPSARDGSPEALHTAVAADLRAFLAGEPSCRVNVRRTPGLDTPVPSGDAPGCTVAFAPWVDGPARFVPPSRWAPPGEADPYSRRDGDAPMMQLVCRVRDDGRCDVWARMNHVAADGVPMQEVLTRLEAAWPAPEPVVYPTPEAFAPFGAPRPAPGGRPGLAEATFFADFSALLSWRRAVNASLPAGETMTISAALLWRLSQQPEFRRLHFGTTVETGEADGLPRGVGVNVVHPARYGGLQGERAVAAYVRDFNRRLWRNRRRAGQGTRTLDAAALLPARYSTPLLLFALSRTRSAIGTMALTMLKDAKVFWTPIAQAGHDDGFIAIGSIALPTADGRRVGCVSIKGPAERIARHTPLIARAIDG